MHDSSVRVSLTISKKTFNMESAVSNAIMSALWHDSVQIYEKMKSSISKMISQARKFDENHNEGIVLEGELEHVARAAIFKGLDKFRSIKDKKKRLMKAETYAYWHILKKIYGAVDVNRVAYDVYDASGGHIGTYSAKTYLQKKCSLPDNHTFQSRRLDVSIEDMKGDKNK